MSDWNLFVREARAGHFRGASLANFIARSRKYKQFIRILYQFK